MKIHFTNKHYIIILAVALTVVVLLLVGGYFWEQNKLNGAKVEKLGLLENKKNLETELSKVKDENTQLSEALQSERDRNDDFAKQIGTIESRVGILTKLSQTDKELLQKYSKVYFLNENYIPDKLSEIDEKYLYSKNQKMLIHAKVQKYLYALIDDATEHDAPLQIISAYRSFGEQTSLKATYKVTYGAGANAFSADQGYSEHQLGTAVDFTTSKLGSNFTAIESGPGYQWLLDNAYKYGFILSYPKGNTYYQFEPWHWRFVGVNLASDLKKQGKHFYDLDQREIDGYLVDIFD